MLLYNHTSLCSKLPPIIIALAGHTIMLEAWRVDFKPVLSIGVGDNITIDFFERGERERDTGAVVWRESWDKDWVFFMVKTGMDDFPSIRLQVPFQWARISGSDAFFHQAECQWGRLPQLAESFRWIQMAMDTRSRDWRDFHAVWEKLWKDPAALRVSCRGATSTWPSEEDFVAFHQTWERFAGISVRDALQMVSPEGIQPWYRSGECFCAFCRFSLLKLSQLRLVCGMCAGRWARHPWVSECRRGVARSYEDWSICIFQNHI